MPPRAGNISDPRIISAALWRCDQLCVAQGRRAAWGRDHLADVARVIIMQRVFSGTLFQESLAASGTKESIAHGELGIAHVEKSEHVHK
jgi:hypothetical protein